MEEVAKKETYHRMKKNYTYFLIFIGFALACISTSCHHQTPSNKDKETPNDWFFLQRSFPYPEINYEARKTAWQQSQNDLRQTVDRGEGWVLKGPYNIGGRISAIAMDPSDIQTIYAGAASGGIFKSTNQGTSWTPVFDEALSLSIGDIAIAPSDPGVIWVGTGEANAGGGSMSYDGFGIYKSTDAGNTWVHVGLENSGSIGRLVVHPFDPQTCFVAAMGRLFSNNPDRGIFRTADGGTTWEKVLYFNDSVGGIDIVMHPDHPDTLYAALWERTRRPDRRNYGGSGSGIYRSYDGGDSWVLLTSGLPSSSPSNGRIGIDISQSDPNVLYAIYADNIGYFTGVYRSNNGGDTWFRVNDADLEGMYSSYGWWFGRINIDPVDPDIAYAIGFDLYKTSDGGNSWSWITSTVHVDHHDIVVHPLNHNFLVNGNDGGIYISDNGGSSWTFLENLPITQFYTCDADEQNPQRLYGGTQDNGTNRTLTGGTNDWQSIYWGDGFFVLVDPTDNNFIYAEYQYGNFARSINGGISFSSAMNGISGADRKNWNTPFVIDPNNPQILYYGANRLYKTSNRAVSWQVISPDLTNGGVNSEVVYGTITTIAVAPSNSQFIYIGTDDGNVWQTADGGGNWTNISAGIPLRWVTRVAVDPYDEQKVYVALSGYRYDNYQPHVFRSTDGGGNWQDIGGDLPEAPANDIIVDPSLDSTLYLATDFGVFITRNLGQNWAMLGDNLPNVPIVDLRFHQPTRTLIAATYGRSMYTFAVDQLVAVKPGLNSDDKVFSIFPNPAYDFIRINYSKSLSGLQYHIFNTRGEKVYTGDLSGVSQPARIDLPGLSNGEYLIKLSHDRKELGTMKLIIAH
jgi:photosystem II stability/assembly factor-like uncharacterized protein